MRMRRRAARSISGWKTSAWPLPLRLGGVHRRVGIAQQSLDVADAIGERDADAAADAQRTPVDLERLAARFEDLARDRHRRLDIRRVIDEHRELIAAEARHGVAGARALDQAVREGAQQLIAGAVPQAVVHGLEVVEIDEQHRRRHAVGDVP